MALLLLQLSAAAPPAVGGETTVEIAAGVRMPRISLGSCCGSEPSVGLAPWLAAGGVGIDTAWDYNMPNYTTQRDIAAVLRDNAVPRESVFITTKVPGLHAQGPVPDGSAALRNDSLAVMKENLRILQVDYVDLALVHFDQGSDEENLRQYRGLEAALAMNMTRAIGVSNFNKAALEGLLKGAKVRPAVNQANWGLHDDETIDYCKSLGITYEAYFALRLCKFDDPVIAGIAAAHNVSSPQVCLRYVLDRGCIITAGTGADPATVGAYARSDLDIFGFRLTQEEVAAVRNLTAAA